MAAKEPSSPAVLVAGPSGAGKSLLISRLADVSQKSDEAPEYRATTGVDLQSRISHPVMSFRELGGAMSSMWSSYSGDADRVLIVIDSTSLASVGEGVALALQVAAGGSSVGLLANKQDAPHSLPAQRVQQLLGSATSDISVMQGSALACDGIAAVLQWLSPAPSPTQLTAAAEAV